MRLNSARISAIITITIVFVVAFAAAAVAAPPWSDASDSWWTSSYNVTEAQVATVADGYPDGTFRPNAAVTRGQFAKMAVSGLGVETANPSTPTFGDVGRGGTFYIFVEGAYKAGLIGGYPSTGGLIFRPVNTITRQQANSILGRYLSKLELDNTGSIHGDVSNYGSLDTWYTAEGKFYLNGFTDQNKVVADHRATTAYLIRRGIVKGSNDRLNPTATLIRSQAAVMVLRVKAEATAILTPPTPPTNLAVVATGTGVQVVSTGAASYVGSDPTPQVTGSTLAECEIAIYDEPFYGTAYIKLGTSNVAGMFYANLDEPTKPLVDGTHSFTAKVRNENGLVSAASAPVAYVLDTAPPAASISAPTPATGELFAVVNAAKPAFTVAASDALSGVKTVEFQVSPDTTPLSWATISLHTNTTPLTAQTTYAAVWPSSGALSSGLADGVYRFRAVVKDLAGNERILEPLQVKVDTVVPTATITAPVPNSGTIHYATSGTPTFTANAADAVSGVAKVEFFYWYDPTGTSPGPTTWSGFTLLSTDTVAPYEASFGSALPNGRYIFAVRATDRAGNQSALLGTSGYLPGVTQEVIIGGTAPIVSVLTPTAGQAIPDNMPYPFTITYSIQAVWPGGSAPGSGATIAYSVTGGEPWTTIAAGIPFTASSVVDSLPWTVPDISGPDVTTYWIRLTAVDDEGHIAVALRGPFTVCDADYPIPGVTGLVGSDPDATHAGVDGRDFAATWVLSASPIISTQKVYLLPNGQTLEPTTDTPVATLGNTETAWSGDSSHTTDSRGAALAGGDYVIWIVVTDPGSYPDGRTAQTASAPFTVLDP